MNRPERDIYFDNSATTRVSEAAAQASLRTMREEYGNPSSVHHRGVVAFSALNQARSAVAAALGVDAPAVYFTSGGTESNNTALLGLAALGCRNVGKRTGRVLYSAVEHPSVSLPARSLNDHGCIAEAIAVDSSGCVDLAALEAQLADDVAVVAVMQVNNETGAIQPLREIKALLKRKAPQAMFHVDGVQGFGRLPAEPLAWGAHTYSASGHKIHAPKGIGLLMAAPGVSLPPLVLGGGQEKNLRSGTENMPGIVAFATAADECQAEMPAYAAYMHRLKRLLLDGLQAGLDNVYVNGPALEQAAPHVLNLSFLGARSEVLLHYFEQQGVYVSAGSACSSHSTKGSSVLQAMALPPERVDSAIRFSLSRFNTEDDVRQAVEIIIPAVREIRAIMGQNKKRR